MPHADPSRRRTEDCPRGRRAEGDPQGGSACRRMGFTYRREPSRTGWCGGSSLHRHQTAITTESRGAQPTKLEVNPLARIHEAIPVESTFPEFCELVGAFHRHRCLFERLEIIAPGRTPNSTSPVVRSYPAALDHGEVGEPTTLKHPAIAESQTRAPRKFVPARVDNLFVPRSDPRRALFDITAMIELLLLLLPFVTTVRPISRGLRAQ